MDLDEAADTLYAGSPEEFVERRKELLTQARTSGDRELAKQIGQLRRPTRSAWLVNLLARAEPEQINALLDLGAALQDAQQRRSGDDLRRLSKDRRTLIDTLSRRAVAIGREQEYQAPDGAVQEVAQTLQAALGAPEVAGLVSRGRLSQATTYGGFGPQDLTAALSASIPTPARETAEHAPTEAAEPEPADPAEQERRAAAERAATEAEEHAADARAAAEEAGTAADEATGHADELADRIEVARGELRELEAAERSARDEARAARKHHQELRQAAADAEQAATTARRDV